MCHLPERLARSIAGGAGMLAARLWIKERRILAETLDRVYHRANRPPPEAISGIVDKTFLHFALDIAEILRFPRLTAPHLERVFHFHHEQHLQEALSRKKGVILVVPHLGSWEMLGAAIAHRGYPLHSFFLAQKENDLGSMLDFFRRFSKIALHDRDRGGIGALKALRRGEVLGMIADQDGGNQAVYGDFLGHWVSIPAGPANWSLKTGAALIPLYSLRRGFSPVFDAWFGEPLPEPVGGTHEENVVVRTMLIIRWMEDLILRHPHQYLWFYDRFKPRHESYLAKLKTGGMTMTESIPVYGNHP